MFSTARRRHPRAITERPRTPRHASHSMVRWATARPADHPFHSASRMLCTVLDRAVSGAAIGHRVGNVRVSRNGAWPTRSWVWRVGGFGRRFRMLGRPGSPHRRRRQSGCLMGGDVAFARQRHTRASAAFDIAMSGMGWHKAGGASPRSSSSGWAAIRWCIEGSDAALRGRVEPCRWTRCAPRTRRRPRIR